MPTRLKSVVPPRDSKPEPEKDEAAGQLISAILEKVPEHKRVIFLRTKYDNNEMLTPTEMADLKRIAKALGIQVS